MYNQITANKRKSWFLVVVFFGLIVALGYFWGAWSGDYVGTMTFASLLAVVMALFGYYQGDKVALRLSGAVPIASQDQNPYVWRMVENLCITQGIPMPKVYLIPDQAMNAFACGRDPEHSSIAVTEGIVQKLENEELEGVIAHELSHIKNYDIRLGTLVIVLVGLVSILSNLFMHSARFVGGRRDREGNAGGVLMLVGFVLILLSPLIANLIKLAVSRRREFLADASGALLTRYPEGLARALEKIAADGTPMSKISEATAHLYFSSPFGGRASTLSKLFSTHPPVAERVQALRAMESNR
jgi:heat shock protein HtpX